MYLPTELFSEYRSKIYCDSTSSVQVAKCEAIHLYLPGPKQTFFVMQSRPACKALRAWWDLPFSDPVT